MSNGYFLADTNSLVYAYRSGGPELLDAHLDAANDQGRKFAITKVVELEIRSGPLGEQLLDYLADRNVSIVSSPNVENGLLAGTLPSKSAGEASMLEVATREQEAGRITRIWADDKYFDSDQIMRRHPDTHRVMSAELLDELFEQGFIDRADHLRFREGYEAQGAFKDSDRLNAFRYDFRAPAVEAADVDAPHRPIARGIAGGVVAEAAVTAYEWNETRRQAEVFRDTLHNESAAQDAYARQGAQTVGSGVGVVAGGLVATTASLGTGGTFALVTADAYLFSKAAERGVELWQQHRIHNVESDGVKWTYEGSHWAREDLRGDLVHDGRDRPTEQTFAASPNKARELSALASAEAVSQVLAGVPTPRDPFVQPASEGDAHSLRTRDWQYQPESGKWLREVVTDLDHRDMPSRFRTVEAEPERAAQLSARAQQIIDANLEAGPATIAAEFQIAHKAFGYDRMPEPANRMPEAVTAALDPDLLQASDGRHYRRDAQGAWTHGNEAPDARRALELEVTRERLLPALEQHRTQLAEMPAWQPPTQDELDREVLRNAYLKRDIDPSVQPERFEASLAAMQRTREETGARGAPLVERDANGGYSLDGSPIHHIAKQGDGVVRVVAVTTPEDIALARVAHPARDMHDAQAPARTLDTPAPAPAPAAREAETPATRTTERRASVADDFAPALAQGRDLRDEAHPGHEAFRSLRQRASMSEALQGIPHGRHTDRIGAAMLQWAVDNKVDVQSVRIGKDPETGALQMSGRVFHGDARGETVHAPFDPRRLSAQPIEASSHGVNAALSPHYAAASPAHVPERTREQAEALGALNRDDQMLFARIRRDIPGQVSDAHVLQAMTQAKHAGVREAAQVGAVMMLGERIVVSGPAAQTVAVDTTQAAASLQASIEKNQTLNQQMTQSLTMQQVAQTQEEPGRALRVG